MTFIIKKHINKKHKAMLKPQCLGVSMTEVTQSKRKYTIHRSLIGLGLWVRVFNTTCNNISAILWR
jgi:hypothetical protein